MLCISPEFLRLMNEHKILMNNDADDSGFETYEKEVIDFALRFFNEQA